MLTCCPCPSKSLPGQGECVILVRGGTSPAPAAPWCWPLASACWSPSASCTGHGRLDGSSTGQLLPGFELQEVKIILGRCGLAEHLPHVLKALGLSVAKPRKKKEKKLNQKNFNQQSVWGSARSGQGKATSSLGGPSLASAVQTTAQLVWAATLRPGPAVPS